MGRAPSHFMSLQMRFQRQISLIISYVVIQDGFSILVSENLSISDESLQSIILLVELLETDFTKHLWMQNARRFL